MWAIARYDLRLSWEEFEEITPKMFWALCKRRNIRLKYERYAHAMTTAAVYNTLRSKADDPVVRPFDFVMDDEQTASREQRKKFWRYAQQAIAKLPMNTPRETLLEKRRLAIADLRASGCKEPETFFDEVWPHLKPREEQCQKSAL